MIINGGPYVAGDVQFPKTCVVTALTRTNEEQTSVSINPFCARMSPGFSRSLDRGSEDGQVALALGLSSLRVYMLYAVFWVRWFRRPVQVRFDEPAS